jgi:hypothetical protein
VSALPLPSPDAQLLAVVVTIRAARGGVGNLTGADLSSLRLADPRGAVEAGRNLGWQLSDALFDGDPDTSVAVTVPDLAAEVGHPLPFGKQTRSRVSGWTTRTLAAKPVKKTTPATRLAALYLAAYSSSQLQGGIPAGLPETCRAALPGLLAKGFLTELTDDGYQLATVVGHLSGLHGPALPATAQTFDTDEWRQWKDKASPAMLRHVETVESCSLCTLPPAQVATAFMRHRRGIPFQKRVLVAYSDWKTAHPDRGPKAARFTVAFRAEHGHGPSHRQLCTGLGWDLKRALRSFVVHRLIVNEWLTDTGPVPWTLRPGSTAQARGIALPGQTPAAAG